MVEGTLADRIAGFLADTPGEHNVDVIARGVRTRRALVIEALLVDERFSCRQSDGNRGHKVRVWSLATAASPGLGMPSSVIVGTGRRRSQNQRVLAILADGEWHTSKELSRRVHCTLHSRIAELRARGLRSGLYRLEHEGQGFGPEHHRYRIVWLIAVEKAAA